MPEVVDSLLVDMEFLDDHSYMPLFVVLKEGRQLDESLRITIEGKIREDISPRLVPHDIIQFQEVPRTLSGFSEGSMKNPEAMKFFFEFRCKLSESRSKELIVQSHS